MARKPVGPLIQTRVSDDVAKWVMETAEAEADSVSGWLRRILTKMHRAATARKKARSKS